MHCYAIFPTRGFNEESHSQGEIAWLPRDTVILTLHQYGHVMLSAVIEADSLTLTAGYQQSSLPMCIKHQFLGMDAHFNIYMNLSIYLGEGVCVLDK